MLHLDEWRQPSPLPWRSPAPRASRSVSPGCSGPPRRRSLHLARPGGPSRASWRSRPSSTARASRSPAPMSVVGHGPYEHDGLLVTLWEYVDHDPSRPLDAERGDPRPLRGPRRAPRRLRRTRSGPRGAARPGATGHPRRMDLRPRPAHAGVPPGCATPAAVGCGRSGAMRREEAARGPDVPGRGRRSP